MFDIYSDIMWDPIKHVILTYPLEKKHLLNSFANPAFLFGIALEITHPGTNACAKPVVVARMVEMQV